MAADKDLDSSKAKSTGAQGGCGTERLKTTPLPSSSSGGSQQKWGWRWMGPNQFRRCVGWWRVPPTPYS